MGERARSRKGRRREQRWERMRGKGEGKAKGKERKAAQAVTYANCDVPLLLRVLRVQRLRRRLAD